MRNVKTIALISLIIWFYYLTYYIYNGLIHPIPALGDSFDYHIPISISILNGSFLHPTDFKLPQWYYPGSSEAFNSLFMLLHIPLTISNIFPIIILFLACFKLALTFRLKYYFSLLFAITIVTLNALVRWYNAVSIDVWVAVFFVLGLILLEKPKKTYTYFAKLGFVHGMLIGSKYTACYFLILLIVVYWKNIFSVFTFLRFLIFLIPFSVFGLFWYIRNYIWMHNPFYPLPVFGFQGIPIFQDSVWKELIKQPLQMINAVYGEYNIWSLLIVVALGIFIYKKITKQITIYGINRLYLIGIINLLLYLTFPTSSQVWIMVSSLRYSFPAFIPLILCVFLVAENYKKGYLLGLAAIGSMLMTLSLAFYPKLTVVYISLALLAKYIIEKHEKRLINHRP